MEDECSSRAGCREKPAVCTRIPLVSVRPCFCIWCITSARAGANHSSALGKIYCQRPLIAYDVILLNQPWHDLFKRKQTHSLCSLYI